MGGEEDEVLGERNHFYNFENKKIKNLIYKIMIKYYIYIYIYYEFSFIFNSLFYLF